MFILAPQTNMESLNNNKFKKLTNKELKFIKGGTLYQSRRSENQSILIFKYNGVAYECIEDEWVTDGNGNFIKARIKCEDGRWIDL